MIPKVLCNDSLSYFVIPNALCNNSLSLFAVTDSLYNNNLSHFVISCFVALCNTNMQKSLRNWNVTLCNKIILSIYLLTFLLTFLPTLDIVLTLKTGLVISRLPQDLWPPDLTNFWLRWGATTNKVTWLFDHIATWLHITSKKQHNSTSMSPMATKLDKMIKNHHPLSPVTLKSLSRGLRLANLTGWWLVMKNH